MHKTISQRVVQGTLHQKTKSIMENSTTLPNWTRESKEKMKYDFSCELYRLSTYSAFPAGAPVSERSLARAGFYYTGVNDKVKCFCCGLMLDNWKQGDSPVEKHRQLYPSCSFVHTLLSASLPSPTKNTAPVRSGFAQSLAPPERDGTHSILSPNPLRSRAVEDFPSRTNPCSYTMTTEEARLLTYSMWPLSFLSPAELARAGFYYLGPGDRVVCFACGGKLSNWEPKDDAMSEHRRHFPSCPFLEDPSQSALRYTVSNVSMQTHSARMRTFLYWPSSVPVQPEQLASAGFYYMDRNDDVKCFCCDGGLRCWESGDDPWVEHAKWFPRCEFLIRMKGQEFVDEIQARYPHLLEQLLSTSDTPEENADPPIVHFRPDESSEDVVMMNTPVVKAALEMGFRRSLVRQTVQRQILATGENYRTVNDIVSALLNAEGGRREGEKDRPTEEMASVEKNMKYIPTEDVSGLSLEEQLRRLQEERTCKVCMDREVSIVFIPCGHLVVCQECAPSLRKCPICRGTIKGTVRTFLS